ncbi:hypothetical protein MUA77_11590 [Mammaliicoccus sciuri]|uniref:hypothetical protein n=1 Tax=Mammaliicoccus sciuri TaxID=1296 RepID=UPI0021D05ABE|nr:hypothetical protein [Mammaliicoccus sciuri]UXU83443.1 hypothetical protein MUA77_11590 [Mammaliicoccus sciuri]UXU93290.1 hypothetical protein MUA42_11600 [Mammaliicoccus sciuri]UXV15239.1 hypothetical protein MUA89_11865 [Mammaliicoccus sciuri]UXV23502.1 hypothetical protein MUA49_11595 [Mammaliicoccus sciuri]UXV26282.1 hypothetical protein MUA96_11850 [Mammaliicoccus sciuri]
MNIFLMVVLIVLISSVAGLIRNHQSKTVRIEKIKSQRVKDELELEKLKHENYLLETDKMRLELEQMKETDKVNLEKAKKQMIE